MTQNKRARISTSQKLIVIGILASVAGGLILSRTGSDVISSSGFITSDELGFYFDVNATEPYPMIYWGELGPGENKSVTFYVKNEGNKTLTRGRINFIEDSWRPPGAFKFFKLEAEYTPGPLTPGAIRDITLTLTVDPDIKGINIFSFDILFSYR